MSPPSRRFGGKAWTVIQSFLIILAATWITWPALRGAWLWDDDLEIAGNPVVRSRDGWWTPWVAPEGMDYFPLKSTLQWAEWHLWSDRVTGYHVANLGLHILSAILIWRTLRRIFALANPGMTPGFQNRGAFLGGLFFAIHPVAVESVAWISEFKNVLSLPPLLLAVRAWIDSEEWPSTIRRSQGAGGRAGPRPPYAALSWFVLAMLCKTSVVMLPVVLLLFAWWLRGRISRGDLLRTAPFFAVSLGLGLVTIWFQGHRAIGAGGPEPAWFSRLAEAGWSAVAYLWECLLPSRLMPIYPPMDSVLPAIVPWAGLAVIFGFCWRWRKSWGRHALLGGGWFFINLAPVLGLIPMAYLRTSPRSDHFVYLPLVGLAGLAGAAAAKLLDDRGRSTDGTALARRRRLLCRCLAIAGITAIGLALAAVGHGYAAVFRSQETLWSEAVRRNPGAWLARNNLGKVRLGQGRLAEAFSLFESAIRLGPPSAEVHANLGSVYESLGRGAEARAQFEESIRIDPSFAGGHYNLGQALLQSGHPAQAAEELRAALQINPNYASAHNNYGLALARLGNLTQAMAEYRLALRIDPEQVKARINLGNAFFRLGRFSEAIAAYREALQVDPGNAGALHNLNAASRLADRAAAESR